LKLGHCNGSVKRIANLAPVPANIRIIFPVSAGKFLDFSGVNGNIPTAFTFEFLLSLLDEGLPDFDGGGFAKVWIYLAN